jgi:hypothetical protein
MPNEREVTIIYKWKPFAFRPIERPKKRWDDYVRKDLQTMKIKNWKKLYRIETHGRQCWVDQNSHRVLASTKNKKKKKKKNGFLLMVRTHCRKIIVWALKIFLQITSRNTRLQAQILSFCLPVCLLARTNSLLFLFSWNCLGSFINDECLIYRQLALNRYFVRSVISCWFTQVSGSCLVYSFAFRDEMSTPKTTFLKLSDFQLCNVVWRINCFRF